ncbi:hypothetical protein GW17_00056574 [Ensete ventricosum]|nr:hypothetical protein GW17_00056574 [Ensete ventricosum]
MKFVIGRTKRQLHQSMSSRLWRFLGLVSTSRKFTLHTNSTSWRPWIHLKVVNLAV